MMDAGAITAVCAALGAVAGAAVWFRLGVLCQAVKDLVRRVAALEKGSVPNDDQNDAAARRLRAARATG